jgi:hypothetical protein
MIVRNNGRAKTENIVPKNGNMRRKDKFQMSQDSPSLILFAIKSFKGLLGNNNETL